MKPLTAKVFPAVPINFKNSKRYSFVIGVGSLEKPVV